MWCLGHTIHSFKSTNRVFWLSTLYNGQRVANPTSFSEQSRYLSLAQINGHMSGKQELAQGMDESRCQRSGLIEHNLSHLPTGIGQQKATDMKDIAHHAQYPVMLQSWACQPATRPDDHIVSQAAQEHHHLLSGKAFFAAFADAQALLVALEGGFDPASPLVVEPDIGEQDGRRILEHREGLAAQREDVLGRQGGEQHAVSELAIRFATAYGDALDRTHIGLGRLGHPTELTLGLMGIDIPVEDALGQAFGLLARIVFAVNQVAASEQPIDIIQTPSSRIHAHDGLPALVLIQLQRLFSGQHQRLQGAGQLRLAIKEAIDYDFPRVTGQHAAQLAASTVALFGKGRFGTARQTAHIHIEHLQAGLIVMLVALTVLAIHAVYGLFHLLHILCGTGIQRILHHQLLGTATAPEGTLQAHIGSQACIDLDESMGSCQHADPCVIELLAWLILDRLLGNLHRLDNWLKYPQFSELDADGSKAGTTAKLLRRRCGRFVHDDASPIVKLFLFDRYASSSFFWQAPFCWHLATNWGQI